MSNFIDQLYRYGSGGLEKYDIRERIGLGAYGSVHRAINRETGVVVALKRPLSIHGDVFRRFRNEIEFYSLTQDSPFIVKMLDFSLAPSMAFVATEFCNKGTFRDRTWELQINRSRTIALLWQVASALTDLHDRGILHRDIKPDNLLVMTDVNHHWIVKMGDPGLACFPAKSVFDFGATRTPKGTEFYIAPELYLQFAVFSAPCDVFSLGVTAHEVLTGQRFVAGSRIIGQGEKLDSLLTRMVSLDQSERPSAINVLNELAQIYKAELVAEKNWKDLLLLVGIVVGSIGIGHLLPKDK